jgi:hypothetical protein
MPLQSPKTTPDSDFFNGRFMVQIEEWNWALSVGISHLGMPRKYRFQGGLVYIPSIEIAGRIRAPGLHRGKQIRIWISTFGREVRFDARTDDVGRFYKDRLGVDGPPFEASLRLPEDALSNALICLGSVWRFLDIWTATDEAESAVTIFSFSAADHGNWRSRQRTCGPRSCPAPRPPVDYRPDEIVPWSIEGSWPIDEKSEGH